MLSRKAKRLETRRTQSLSHVRTVRVTFESMLTRCNASGETPNAELVESFTKSVTECESRIRAETDLDQFDWLEYQADTHGQLRAYLCPKDEIYTEGISSLELLRD